MTIKIYNTLTRQKERFIPLEDGKVKMYVCGPTVYNYIHIGNARPAIVFDTVRRYLQYRNYEVKYVLNFTDVDDKLIQAAAELESSVPEIADKFITAYRDDVSALGCEEANVHPRVTESIDIIIEFIEQLISKDYAYESGGDVYFRTKKFADYGKLSDQSIDELQLGARINVGEKKTDPLDFVLWKSATAEEISWDSPWGRGRPGWHIECSAMAREYLGDTIDIHAGGHDLTFPHHENEIAQSEALTGKTFANYWMHNGYINIDDEKMSKSIGNVILVKELIKQYDPRLIRFFMLSVHYRSPINYSEQLLETTKASFERLQTAYDNLLHRQEVSVDSDTKDEAWFAKIADQRNTFIKEMDDDFNTANAITVLFEIARLANVYSQQETTSLVVIAEFIKIFDEISNVLGITFKTEQVLLDEEIEQLLAERVEARKNHNFARADEIRDQLKALDIVLEDTPQGTRWKRG